MGINRIWCVISLAELSLGEMLSLIQRCIIARRLSIITTYVMNRMSTLIVFTTDTVMICSLCFCLFKIYSIHKLRLIRSVVWGFLFESHSFTIIRALWLNHPRLLVFAHKSQWSNIVKKFGLYIRCQWVTC